MAVQSSILRGIFRTSLVVYVLQVSWKRRLWGGLELELNNEPGMDGRAVPECLAPRQLGQGWGWEGLAEWAESLQLPLLLAVMTLRESLPFSEPPFRLL